MAEDRRSQPPMMKTKAAAAITLIVATLALTGWRVGVPPLGDWDEALTGSRSLGMLESRDWLTVHFNGEPDFHKPPLYYWLASAAYRVGGVSEATTRLPSVLAAAAVIVLECELGTWIAGETAGLLAAASLLTIPAFAGHARQAQPDMVLFAASLAAILAFLRERHLATGVAVAAAVLTKGLAGLLAPLALACHSLATLHFGFLRSRRFWFGAVLGVILVAPWAVWNLLAHAQGFRSTFVGAEVEQRIFWTPPWGPTGTYYLSVGHDTLGAVYWLAPLSLIAIPFRLRAGESWRRHALVPALLVAAVLALCITHPKNGHYILVPAIPLSLAVGVGLSALPEVSPWIGGPLLALAVVFCGLRSPEVLGLSLTPIVPIVVIALLAGLATAGARPFRRWMLVHAYVLLVALAATAHVGEPRALGRPNHDLQKLASQIQKLVPPDAPLLADRTALQGLVFYGRRKVMKTGGYFFRGEPHPEKLYGIFSSDLYRGIAGYDPQVLAQEGRSALVRLVRNESEAVPTGPRLIHPEHDSAADAALQLLGAQVTTVPKNGYVNSVVLRHPALPDRALDRRGWHLSSEDSLGDSRAALDGDSRTDWRIGRSQSPGLAVMLDLGHVERVSALSLLTADPTGFPHGLAVSTATREGDWAEIVRVGEYHPGFRLTPTGLDFARDYAVHVHFEPREARFLRLEVTVGTPLSSWSLAELDVFGD